MAAVFNSVLSKRWKEELQKKNSWGWELQVR